MESRVAVVENGVLQEVHVERTQRRGIVGNIYKGKVVRVLPGMQSAFIDIGLERAAFLLHDVFDLDYDEIGRHLDRNEAACRQLISRARKNVKADYARREVAKEEGERLV
eukprot:gene18939-23200_t